MQGYFGLHRFIPACLAAILLAASASAQLAPPPGRNAILAGLVPESATAVPGGTVTLALTMKPSEGWHGYWKNPGDSGIETQIAWDLPAGLTAGPIRYPVPARLIVSGLMNYVYKGDYAQLIELRVPADVAPGTELPIRARVDYLACTDKICVPETANVAVDLKAGPASAEQPNRAMFDRFRQALPKPLGAEARFEVKDNRFRLAIPFPAGLALDAPYFYPLTDGALAYSAPQSFSRSGDTLIVETDAASAGGAVGAVEGVLRLGEGNGVSLRAAPGAVPAAGPPLASEAERPAVGAPAILAALLGAILGGLLLNVMPCVFPILSLKALSLAKAGGGEDEGAARREALAYTAGAVLICLALGAALLGLRAGGAAAGWAFQLQDPRVILALLLLITAVALNLAGLFELPAVTAGGRLAERRGLGGAFWTGALAAFVATPCTGPFMGAALGAALVLPTAVALAIFAGLGLGLALPFLLLGFVPALRRRLPRSGPWMGRFRRLMSVPMFLTALALAWILGRQAGVDGMALGLAAAMILALALWWVGRRHGRARAWLPLAPAALAALVAGSLVSATPPGPATASAGILKSEPFSEARLAALRQEGRSVFVYFTADWCVTCKVNEKGALDRTPVAKAFEDRNVAVLVGDWTRGDSDIGRFLASHGRSGVPLYLYYAPGKPVEILPQVLTPSRLVSMVS